MPVIFALSPRHNNGTHTRNPNNSRACSTGVRHCRNLPPRGGSLGYVRRAGQQFVATTCGNYRARSQHPSCRSNADAKHSGARRSRCAADWSASVKTPNHKFTAFTFGRLAHKPLAGHQAVATDRSARFIRRRFIARHHFPINSLFAPLNSSRSDSAANVRKAGVEVRRREVDERP